jgi:hypothetical protein
LFLLFSAYFFLHLYKAQCQNNKILPSQIIFSPEINMKHAKKRRHSKRGKKGGNFFKDAGNWLKGAYGFMKDNHFISDAAGVAAGIAGGPAAGLAAKIGVRAIGGSCHPRRRRKHKK